jgi:hypothetical protein
MIIFLLNALASCYKELELRNTPAGAMPVVNCLFRQDSIWTVNVSLSSGDNSSGALYVQDALVRISGDNGYTEQLTYANEGNFVSGTGQKPLPGVVYRLEVVMPGFDPITATGNIPSAATLHVAHFDTSIITITPYPLSDPVKTLRAQFSVSDDSDEERFYLLRPVYYKTTDLTIYKVSVETIDTLLALSRITRNDSIRLTSILEKDYFGKTEFDNAIMPLLEFPTNVVFFYEYSYSGSFDAYDPQLFQSQRGFVNDIYFKHLADDYHSVFGLKPEGLKLEDYKLDIFYSYFPGDSYVIENGNVIVEDVKWFLEGNTLSEEAYLYLTTYLQNIANRNNPFAEHINVYSNIQNGLGIFAGINSKKIKVN